MKADFLDRRVRLNLAAYSSRLTDQQVDFVNPAFVSNTETVNAPEKRRLKGIEADLTLAPVRGLLLTGNYVYSDAPSTPVRNIFTGVIQAAGSAFTPKHAATFAVDYAFPAFSFGKLRTHIDFDTAGGYLPNGSVTALAKKTVLVNSRISLGEIDLAGSNLELSLWGKNLTNRTFNLVDVRVVGRNTITIYNDPRTYGVEARIRF